MGYHLEDLKQLGPAVPCSQGPPVRWGRANMLPRISGRQWTFLQSSHESLRVCTWKEWASRTFPSHAKLASKHVVPSMYVVHSCQAFQQNIMRLICKCGGGLRPTPAISSYAKLLQSRAIKGHSFTMFILQPVMRAGGGVGRGGWWGWWG